jgi:hypothetical protein
VHRVCVSVACTTTTPIRFDPPQPPPSLRPGTTVVAELNTGQRVTVFIGSTDATSIVDGHTGRRYRFADIRSHQRVAVGRTIGLTAGIIGGALLMLIGIAVACGGVVRRSQPKPTAKAGAPSRTR